MKRIVLLVAFMLGMCLLFASCEKQDASSFVGTWNWVEEGKTDNGDYVVIEDNFISFYYGKEGGFDNGVKYKFEYEQPHIFIAGINTYDVVSKSQNSMIWEGVPMGSYTQRERYMLTKVDERTINSLKGTWSFVIEGEKDKGTYVVIDDSYITYYYGLQGSTGGEKHKYVYKHPHIIEDSGLNIYDVVSITPNQMVWKLTEEGYSYYLSISVSDITPEQRYILTRK